MPSPSRKPHIATITITVLVVLAVAGFVWLVKASLSGKNQKPARVVQIVQVIRPPPPPPDQPPPPPPPPKVQEEIPQNQPDPSPDPSPSQQLGLDADGSAGSDAFGLAAHRGGSDLLGTSGAAFAWYTSKLKEVVVERLTTDTRIHARKFSVSVRVWIEPDGSIKEARLSSSTGDRELDRAITDTLSAMHGLGESPPLEMPQPVILKIVSQSS
jgi:protein TonB